MPTHQLQSNITGAERRAVVPFGWTIVVLSVLLVLAGAPVQAQAPEGWEWSRSLNGPLDDSGEAVAIDTANGSHYTVGHFQSDGALDWLLSMLGLSVRGGYDGLIVKSDANGNNIWTLTIGQTGEDRCLDVCVAPNGNIFVTGRFSGTNAVFGTGHTLTSAGGTDLFVASYDPNGTLLWKVRGGGTGNDGGTSIAYSAGKVFVTGTVTGAGTIAGAPASNTVNTTGLNAFIAAFDATTGAGLWRVDCSNTNNSYLNGITADVDRVYAIGQFTGTSYRLYASSATLGPVLTTPAGRTENGFVVALDHNGAFAWNVAISDAASGGETPQALAIANSSGGVFVTGRSHNGTTFPGNTTVNASGNPHDYAYLARLSKVNGTTTWVRTLRSTAGGSNHMQAGRDLAVDPNGDVCMIGSFRQSLDFPNGSTVNGTSDKQVFVAKFGAMGAFKWGLTATGNQDDLGNGIATDGHGGITVCGTWNDEITFNVDLDANGGNNLFLAHLNDIHFSVSASRKQSDWTPFGPVCANSAPVDLTTTHIPLQAGPGAAVQSSNGVALPEGALGLQAGGEALFDNNGDRVTIDMGAAAIVPAGQNFLMRWRRSSGSVAATAFIEVSADASAFTTVGSFQTNSATHTLLAIPVPIATRYIRITRAASATNFSVDGLFQDIGTDPGGVWSGAGVSGTSFNPSGLSGPVQITYTVNSSSTTHAVQVDALSSTGTLSAPNSGMVCPNGGTTVSLSGATATTNIWSTSTNGGGTWTTVANNVASHTLANVSQATRVRVELRNGVCPSVSQAMDLVPQDLIAPTITCPANTTVNASPGQCGAVVSYPMPGVSDNCSASAAITIVCLDPAKVPGSFFAVGTHTVVLRATDAAGNSSDCSFLITVANNLPATFSGCTDITVPIDAPLTCAVPVSYTAPTATDVCGQSVIPSHTAGPTSGSLFPIGSTTVTYSATVGTNTHSCSFQVTVVDMAPPLIEAQALPILYTDADCRVTVPDLTGHFPASSDCSGPLTVTQTPAVNASVPAGTLVQLHATDPLANDTVVDIALLTVDTIAPVLTCPSSVSANIPNGACAVQVYFASPTLSDNCSPAILTDSIGGGSGTWYGAGQHSVHYTAQDASGNAGHCTVGIEVLAPGAPVLAYGTATACATSGTLTPTVASPAGGTFSGTPGLIINGSGTVDLGASAPGDHQVRYTFPGACAQTAVFDLHIDGPAVATTNVPAPFCGGTGALDASGNGPGVWSGPAAVTILNPSAPQTGVMCSTPGSYTLTWTVTHGVCTAVGNATISFVADPSANAGNDMSLCVDHASVTLNGLPAGGSWSGTAVSGNLFTPSAAGVGVHQAVYAVTNAQGCIGTDTVTFTVQALPTVNAGSYASLCSNGSSITLTGTPTGGAWSGIGVSGGAPYTFNPAVGGAGTHLITHTFTDANGCTGSGQTTITVNPTPTVTTGNYGPLCDNGAPITLNGSPSGGMWSGTGVTGNTFDPASGTQTVTYTYSNGSCTKSASTTIVVHSAPNVTPGSYGPLCSNGPAITLSGTPASGSWSGTGVSGNSFNPSNGTQTLTYSFTSGNGCTRSAQTTITVNVAPTVTTGSYGPLCSNGTAITLNGSPAGGTWSGTGVSGNTFNPASGTQTVTYTYSNGSCTKSAQTTITVNAPPTVATGSYGPLCSNGTAITLTGSPVGGTWSGTGVSGNTFNPASGTQTVTYSYTNANGCTRTAQTTILVNVAPTVTAGSYGPLCENGSAITLTGSPAGGTWSGIGVSGNTFNPANGTQTLTYSYTNANGCTRTAQTTITVHPAPTVSTGGYGPLCNNGSAITLTGSPAGGTWSGTGVSGNTFNPASGTQTLTYSYTNANGCTRTAQTTITVHPAPTVSTGSYGPLCDNGSAITLTGSPAGGTWSGTGVSGNTFNPASGTQTLTYSYTNANGCTRTAQTTILVNVATAVIPGSYGPLCSNVAPINLGGSPTGGTWSGTGVSGTTFNPANGTQTLTYAYTDVNGCSRSEQTTITVFTPTVLQTVAPQPVCATAASFPLNASPSGGTWSGPGVQGGQFAPPIAGPGMHTVLYTYTNANGCISSTGMAVQVYAVPSVDAGTYPALCADAEPFQLQGLPSDGTGTWSFSPTGGGSGQGLTGDVYDPAFGSQVLIYSFTDANGCGASDQATITIHDLPVIDAGADIDVCTDADPVVLTPSPDNGTWSGGPVADGLYAPAHGSRTLLYTVTDANGCSASDEVTITVHALPVVAAGADVVVCADAGTIQLAPQPTNGTWSSAAVVDGTYDVSLGDIILTYTFTDANGCTAMDDLAITVNAVPVVDAGADISSCADGASIALAPQPPGGTWNNASVIDNTYAPSSGSAELTYSFTDAQGCSASDALSIVVHAVPTVNAGSYAPVCSDADDVILQGLPAGGTWQGTGVAGGLFDPAQGTQVLTYTFTDANGCTAQDDVQLTVTTSIEAQVGNYGPVCSASANIELNGTPANGTWTGPGVNGNVFQPAGLSGDQVLTYTVGNGACQAQAQTTITVFAQPVVSAGPDAEACADGHPLIGSTSAGSGIWSAPNGCTTTSIGTMEALAYMPQTGTYTFTWTVTNGLCSASDAITLTYHDPSDELWANAGPDQDFDIYLSTPLNGDATATADIRWSVLQGSGLFTDASAPITDVTNLSVGDNLLVLSASFGTCRTESDTVRIKVNEVFIPQGFSPNGDGVNDLFEVTGALVFLQSELRVFDRWGNTVFRSGPYRNEWNGEGHGGNALPDGTYYYTLELAPERLYNGFVVIKR